MSIAISCNLSDGVVMGVDSAIALTGRVEGPEGPLPGLPVLKVYKNAEKLFPLCDLPMAIATFGMGMLGQRTLESYVREFEKEYDWGNGLRTDTVEGVARKLRDFFEKPYREILEREYGKKLNELIDAQRPLLGLAVAGFSPSQALSEVWEVLLPRDLSPTSVKQIRKRGEFGTTWSANFAPIQRLIKGYDQRLLDELLGYFAQRHNVKVDDKVQQDIGALVQKHESRIPYQAMPIEEGIDHVRYLLDVVISHTRFVIGAPICDGPVRLAVVTLEGVKWVQGLTPTRYRLTPSDVRRPLPSPSAA
jgi:hypothetical protein